MSVAEQRPPNNDSEFGHRLHAATMTEVVQKFAGLEPDPVEDAAFVAAVQDAIAASDAALELVLSDDAEVTFSADVIATLVAGLHNVRADLTAALERRRALGLDGGLLS